MQSDYRRQFSQLAERFESIAKTEYERLEHLAVDVANHIQRAIALLDQATDAGHFGRWRELRPVLQGNPLGAAMLAAEAGEVGDARLMWTHAITSWLTKDYPERFARHSADLFWWHGRRNPDVHPVFRYDDDRDGPAPLGRAEDGRRITGWHLPEGAVVRDGSKFGHSQLDAPDEIDLRRKQARACADACRLLADLAEDGATAPVCAGEAESDRSESTAADAVNPDDYLFASEIIANCAPPGFTIKKLNAALVKHPEIRRFKPSERRLCVHVGDWFKFKRSHLPDQADPTPADIQRRSAEIRAVRPGK